MSLPSWERGLKYAYFTVKTIYGDVAPLVGAWIEIPFAFTCLRFSNRRSPRGSVD